MEPRKKRAGKGKATSRPVVSILGTDIILEEGGGRSRGTQTGSAMHRESCAYDLTKKLWVAVRLPWRGELRRRWWRVARW